MSRPWQQTPPVHSHLSYMAYNSTGSSQVLYYCLYETYSNFLSRPTGVYSSRTPLERYYGTVRTTGSGLKINFLQVCTSSTSHHLPSCVGLWGPFLPTQIVKDHRIGGPYFPIPYPLNSHDIGRPPIPLPYPSLQQQTKKTCCTTGNSFFPPHSQTD